MNTPVRLGAFALGLVVVFGLALGIGRVTGPVRAEPGPSAAANAGHQPGAGTAGHGGSGEDSGHDAGQDAQGQQGAGVLPLGLQVTERGYTLRPVTQSGGTSESGETGEFAFRITGPDGRPVTAFDTRHDKRMHLIVVRRDLSGFRHVHPRMEPDGTWRIGSPFGDAGAYRAFADFQPTGGEPLTLGVDVIAAGESTARPLPSPATSTTVDGYTVLLGGTPQPGRGADLTFTVTRDGRPVTDLQPYLGAYGHLVALRAGDLAYLHVHPNGTPGDGSTRPGPGIGFHTEVPSAGTYRLYLDFQHDGTVHTAEFTVVAGQDTEPGGVPPVTPERSSDGHGSHDH